MLLSLFALTIPGSVGLALNIAGSSALHGKRCLVTGSCGRFGTAIAKHLAGQGAQVILQYHEHEANAVLLSEEINSADDLIGSCEAVLGCDFREQAAITNLWNAVDDVWKGEIDILVNAASVTADFELGDPGSVEMLEAFIGVNSLAPLAMSIEAHKRMTKNLKGGDVVMICPPSKTKTSNVQNGALSVDQLTRDLAGKWATDGVRVNAVAPGQCVHSEWNVEAVAGAVGTLCDPKSATWANGAVLELGQVVHQTRDDDIEDVMISPGVSDPKATEAAPPLSAEDARVAAMQTSSEFGARSKEAMLAWETFEEISSQKDRMSRVIQPSLAEGCDPWSTAPECIELSRNLYELDKLIKKGPNRSRKFEIARQYLRGIEEASNKLGGDVPPI